MEIFLEIFGNIWKYLETFGNIFETFGNIFETKKDIYSIF